MLVGLPQQQAIVIFPSTICFEFVEVLPVNSQSGRALLNQNN